jgi:hypothetical protein
MRGSKIYFVLILLFYLAFASAEACDPQVSLLNQDPYPAVPGDYVKLVFQVTGLDNPDCDDFTFELLNDYPIIFDPNEATEKLFKKVNFLKDYESNLLIPYEVRIDEDALDGANPIEAKTQIKGGLVNLKTFNIEVQETKVLFEVYVKDYDYLTHELNVEVLNIGDSDIRALTLEIPRQEKIQIKGPNRIVVGDLDSNEYTSADFEAIVSDGLIDVNLIYTDSINVRRGVTEKVNFDSSYFTNRIKDQKKTSTGTYVLYAIIVLLVVWFIVRKFRKKKK